MRRIANGHGATIDAADVPGVVVGTMVSKDLVEARKFYEEFVGLECVQPAPGKLLLRDHKSAELMKRGQPGGFVIEVTEVDEITHPQNMLNHWGLAVESVEAVDKLREFALANQARFGLQEVNPITKVHGSYQFYFSDRDGNWWEFEYRLHGRTMEMVFEAGDFKRAPKPEQSA